MSREQLDRLGARYDGVEILHVDPGPAPGSTMEKRAIRQVGLVFTLAGVFAFLFVVVYVGSGWFLPDWHWQITEQGWSSIFTPRSEERRVGKECRAGGPGESGRTSGTRR